MIRHLLSIETIPSVNTDGLVRYSKEAAESTRAP